MSYELIKKLKEAGFPLIEIKAGMNCSNREYFDANPEGDPNIGAQHFFVPTLEELVRASNLCRLIYLNQQWYAESHAKENTVYSAYGKTLTDAISNLYLALNEKEAYN